MRVAGVLLMISGSLLGILSAVGVARLRTPLARMHAAAKPASLGLALVALGSGLAAGSWHLVALGALVAVFQFLTAPVAGHLLGRSAARLVELPLPEARTPTTPVTYRRWPLVALIAVVWPVLWRDFRIANLVAGTLLGLLVALAVGSRPSTFRVNPINATSTVARYIASLVRANLRMVGQVLRMRPEDLVETVVICDLATRSEQVAFFDANATSFSPGTLTLEISDRAPYRMIVHAMGQDAVEVVEEIQELEISAGRMFS